MLAARSGLAGGSSFVQPVRDVLETRVFQQTQSWLRASSEATVPDGNRRAQRAGCMCVLICSAR